MLPTVGDVVGNLNPEGKKNRSNLCLLVIRTKAKTLGTDKANEVSN